MNFLFWNIQKKNTFFDAIREVLICEDIDVLMLAEFPIDTKIEDFTSNINNKSYLYSYNYVAPKVDYQKVKVFTRFPDSAIQAITDSTYFSAKKIFSSILKEYITIIMCHLPSKVNYIDDEQSEFVSSTAIDFINKVEKEVNHQRTIICGDFNMNPFDKGIIKANGFHAVMDKTIAKNKYSTISGKKYDYLYNPMWGLLGDIGKGNAPGTMYYNPSKYFNYYWNMFDQVLIRPELIDLFDCNLLDIIIKTKNHTFINNNIINKKYSDHLPIKFNLKI